ncbi:MAG: polyprenyl synthetase family protein [Leptotrichiaceae bacterium]|nr:polyprenyl synthetase family protein [Leptotrichiaceae bacterium]MBP6281220.1 polyprenyl synthetase family protein [Leptotrichiaceae bacterium]MBP7100178.1 polyprenyl synthetase family protein [Leptotrichiaceae bacterium]MBP7725613.1 polyprenyl synthetase family protein [Leptotrichiaceae bacterium]MBP9630000.1 polyprenyl synthetase family protein [Leptotrichiaceae bacterium]
MFKNYLEEKKEIIEKNLKKSLSKYKYPERLSEGMEYAVMNGGKRIRPVIMYIICDLFEKEYKYIEDIALALEFIHCYSLVHDDLPAMDDDMYRRGKLTTHIKYDEATAILVGDALLTEAFNIISDSKNIKDKNKVQIIRKLSEYAGFYGMIGGQYLDIESENKEVSIETLEYIHTHKTGKLLTASVELPLIALDIEDEKIEKLIEYSKLIGIVFQIKDDILDIEGTFEETGKESTDIKNDKKTYPSLFGMEKSKEMLNDYINRAKNIIIENCDENKLFIELVDFFGNRGV